MSMTTEQVKRLRDAANRFDAEGAEPSDGDLMREAADTIEALSEKVRAANMERSTAYYNGGWIPVSERLPRDLEPVYPKEKTGHWMTYKAVNTGEILAHKCNLCKYEVYHQPKTNFCPNCGAKMQEVEE